MEKDLVSIVVPAYNAEQTVERCARSLLGQSYRNFELLLIDDGSKDQTFAVCQKLAEQDDRVRAIHKANGGVSSARNLGIDESQGRYIVFVDADDWVEPDYLSNFMENKQPSGLVVCEVTHDDLPHQEPVQKKRLTIQETQIAVLGTKYILGYPFNKMFDQHLIKRNHIRFDEKISMGEDLLFCMQYLYFCNGEIVYKGRQTYHYVVTDNGAVKSHFIGKKPYNEKMLSETEAIEASAKYVYRQDLGVQTAWKNRYLKAAVNSLRVLAVYQRTDDPAYPKMQRSVRNGALRYILASHNALSSKLSVLLSAISPLLELYFWRKYNRK